jgi:hypothetical protein
VIPRAPSPAKKALDAAHAELMRIGNPILGFLRSRSRRFWKTFAILASAITVTFVGLEVASGIISDAYSPQQAAIDFINALVSRDVPQLLDHSVVVPCLSA